MHCLIKKNSHRKWVCRRCLTAFSSEQIFFDHTSRFIKQQPTDITFSWKDHLKFVDNFMKIPLPIIVYADFECIIQPTRNDSKVLIEQIPLAVGFYLISPFGNQYYYIGESCVTWFVKDFWSTLKQTTPPDEEIYRTQEIKKKYDLMNGQELIMLYLKMDVLQIADAFENFVGKSTLEYGFNLLYSYSLPGYTWKAGLKLTNIKLDYTKDKEVLLLLDNNIRAGITSVMGPRYIESDENTKLLYNNANNFNRWAMCQYLPTGTFEKLCFLEEHELEQIMHTTTHMATF